MLPDRHPLAMLLACVSVLCLYGSGGRAATVSDPTYCVGGSSPIATSQCVKEFEPVLTRTPTTSSQVLFAPFNWNWVSTAVTTWNNWIKHPTNRSLFADETIPLAGDAYSVYSQQHGLVYASYIGHPQGGGSCIAIGATDPATVSTETWTYPVSCAAPVGTADRPVIAFDNYPQRPALFASSNPLNGSYIDIYAYVPCNHAQPGGTGCSQSAHVTMPLYQNHWDLAVNPCTGDLVVAYRADSSNDIRLRILNRNTLAVIKDWLVMSSQTWSGATGPNNTGCTSASIRRCALGTTDCANGYETGQCLRVLGGPQIVIERHNNQHCYAAVGWDVFVRDGSGNYWSRSRAATIDVTNELSPVNVSYYISNPSTTAQWNDYMTQIVSTDYTDDLGWFWITDTWGACKVFQAGAVDSDFGLVTMTGGGPLAKMTSYDWPTMIHAGYGQSDYWKGTGRLDKLYPVWAESVQTGVSCVSCQGKQWSLAAKLQEVNP